MRNLTGGDPYAERYESLNQHEEPPQNPFMSETHTLDSEHSSDAYSLQSDARYPERSPFNPEMDPNYNYNYSSNNLAVPGSRQSTTSLTGLSQEYDRYPNRVSSAAPSLNSSSGQPLLYGGAGGAAAGAGAAGMMGQRTSTMSDGSGSSFSETDYKSNNPFVVNADFSPFGGYPASAFPLHMEEKEADDYLHNPDPILDAKWDRRCAGGFDKRGLGSLGALACLIVGGIMIFIVLPVLTYTGITEKESPTVQSVLSNYEYGKMAALRTDLIDPDTPDDAKSYTSNYGDTWELVFSDEFNKEGRTFYENDDQFFTAVDINYASTQDLEWYSPDAATTENGSLVLRLDAYKNHDLFYRSAMVQSWNKLCFSQGKIEASVLLPGSGKVLGLWPGVWTMGNLGRPGYRATTDGVWPYSYNSCDAGITPNQSSPDGISWLPGQRLSSCVCKGHDHPSPGIGRGAPEIDLIEGTVGGDAQKNGVASQSLQLAPFDIWYYPNYDFIEIHNKSVTAMNTYTGGPLQQALSGTTQLNTDWYEFGDNPSYQAYGIEYLNDPDKGYIRWFVGEEPTFTMYQGAIGPNGNVGERPISKEPMSIIMNLGISNSWTYIDWPSLKWPSTMRIDYVRIYQPSDAKSITCDPPDYPTYDYIQNHLNAYQNVNLTMWDQAGYAFPPNKLTGGCS